MNAVSPVPLPQGAGALAPKYTVGAHGLAYAMDALPDADATGSNLTPAGKRALVRPAPNGVPNARTGVVVPLHGGAAAPREIESKSDTAAAELTPPTPDPPRAVTPRIAEAREARPTPAAQPAVRFAEGSRLTPSNQSAGRPPVLASEALRKDLAPATPAGTPVRKVTVALGAIGMIAALALSGASGIGLPLAGAFLALALLGAVPMPYQARAAALVTVAASGLSVVTWSKLQRTGDVERVGLLIGVLVLSVALLFRSWHRASLLARALVALGATVCGGWLVMSGVLQRLLVLEGGWQQWVPSVLPLALAIVLLLSLLAFMDSRSTGACSAWAALLLGWYTLYTWTELLARGAGAAATSLWELDPEFAMAVLSGPLFAAVLAAGLAQLLSVATAAEAG